MATIYFHIPFCKQKCFYCDFYSEIAPQYIDSYIDTMIEELYLRKFYLPKNEKISSIYFGGGTPSLLTNRHFEKIFYAVNQLFIIRKKAEITFEANPDDLSDNFFNEIKSLPFNRLSIGIQSFNDKFLKKINRRHTAQQAVEAIQLAKNHNFTNISIDLIFGLPTQKLNDWKNELKTAFLLDIQHISAYCLTYEEGTPLYASLRRGEVSETSEKILNEMYLYLIQSAKKQGFEHYEISNFAKKSFRSQHNSAYWNYGKYLGVGAAAHSFDGKSRQWNVRSIENYIAAIASNSPFFEKELLTEKDKYNEYIMLALRTAEGVDLEFIMKNFNKKYGNYFLNNIQKFITLKKIHITEKNIFLLTKEGILISNSIISELMM
ncbi:MAG: radical SAM family heme chaperone HemW [Paludibacter sp.]|nr:radical SAM family heme chaperone HemW [Paludibacter sp.]